MRRTERRAAACAVSLAAALCGCSFAPPLVVPDVPVAGAYREQGPWVLSQPADALPREAWWTLYGDPELDALQQRLVANSPDLAAALARYQQAIAYSDQLRAGLLPRLALTGSALQNRQAEQRPLRVLGPGSPDEYGAYTLGLQADYELDFWGRIRNQVASGSAAQQASQADLEAARLSLQAQLADLYITLRGFDRQSALYRETVGAYAKALELTQTRYEGGIASGLDVARAQTQLETARAQIGMTLAQRALTEHAIAALIGESASGFAIEPRLADIRLPHIPAGLPSALLQRRPDIAAAQARIAAANANIGVSQAAWFPAVTLSGTLGFQSTTAGSLLRASNVFWALGPSVFLTLFDAGRRDAELAQRRAELDETGARYRGVVLGAFQQVEDNLALLNHYRAAAQAEQAAVVAANRSLELATSRYRDGAANYLEVVTAQAAALNAQRDALDLDTRQRRASVQLVRALGGGWSSEQLRPVSGG